MKRAMPLTQLTLYLVFLSFLAATAGADPVLQLSEDFEDCGERTELLTAWRPSGNDILECIDHPKTRVGAKKYTGGGHKVLVAHLDPELPNKGRSEISNQRTALLEYDKEYWISFQMNVAAWEEPYPRWSTLFQLHSIPGGRDWSCPAGRNPFTVSIDRDGRLAVAAITNPYAGEPPEPTGALADFVWTADLEKGHWYNFDVQLIPSTVNGMLKVWVDGDKVYDSGVQATVDLLGQRCDLPPEPVVYTKIGIYRKSNVKSSQDVWYDNLKIYRLEE